MLHRPGGTGRFAGQGWHAVTHAAQTFGLILAELLVLFSVISVFVALVNRRFGPDRIQR